MVWCKAYFDILNRLGVTEECHGRTDGQEKKRHSRKLRLTIEHTLRGQKCSYKWQAQMCNDISRYRPAIDRYGDILKYGCGLSLSIDRLTVMWLIDWFVRVGLHVLSDGHWLRSTTQLAERRSLAGELTLQCPVLDLQLTGDHYVGKPSAEDQPTRPTQPFILSGSINE